MSKHTSKGLSPRVRGNPAAPPSMERRTGSIPACAGEPAAPGGSGTTWWVYPRVCGGTALGYARADLAGESAATSLDALAIAVDDYDQHGLGAARPHCREFDGIPLADELFGRAARTLLHPQVAKGQPASLQETPNEHLVLRILAEQHRADAPHGEFPGLVSTQPLAMLSDSRSPHPAPTVDALRTVVTPPLVRSSSRPFSVPK